MKTSTVRWLSGASVILGLLLVTTPIFVGVPAAADVNTMITGAAIAALSGYNYAGASQGQPASRLVAGLNVLAGAWVLAGSYFLGVAPETVTATRAIATAVIVFSSVNAWKGSKATDGAEP